MLGWDFSVSPKSLFTDFADYPDEIEEKRYHGEGADLRRLKILNRYRLVVIERNLLSYETF